MAGGRKTQKRKRNWRAVLEGCFNRSPFGSGSAASKSPPVEKSKDTSAKKKKSKISSRSIHTSQSYDESLTEAYAKKQPLRGILKKSPSISLSGAEVSAGASGDAGDSHAESCHEWSQVRPAYLIHSAAKSAEAVRNNNEGSSYDCPYDCTQKQQNNEPCCEKENAYKKPRDSFTDIDGKGYSSSRLGTGAKEIVYDNCRPIIDEMSHSYDVLRDRLHPFQEYDPSKHAPVISREKVIHSVPNISNRVVNDRWSFPQYDPEEIYSRPLPSPPESRRGSMIYQRHQSPEAAYIPVQEIRKRKQQHQKLPQHSHHRPLSAPVTAWQENGALTAAERNSLYQPMPVNIETDLSVIPKIVYNLVDLRNLNPNLGSNRHLTNATSRSRDPIRKPMGSLYCPYSNSLYKAASVGHVDNYQSERSSSGKQECQRSSVNCETGHACGGLPDHTVEVSHIYATVTRSSTRASTSSYVYASISYKTSIDPPIPSHLGRSCQLSPPDIPPPPVPPRMWSNGRHHGQYNSPDSDQCFRRPLPSYEEVIESRVRYKHRRPVSWCETYVQETDRRREAFMQLLAQRYPQYADRIQGVGLAGTAQPLQPDKDFNNGVSDFNNGVSDFNNGVSENFNNGVSADFNNGVSEDFNNGVSEDFNNGVSENFNNGVSEDFNNGVSEDFNNGVSEDFNNSVSENFNNGVSADFNNGVSEDFNNGVSSNWKIGGEERQGKTKRYNVG